MLSGILLLASFLPGLFIGFDDDDTSDELETDLEEQPETAAYDLLDFEAYLPSDTSGELDPQDQTRTPFATGSDVEDIRELTADKVLFDEISFENTPSDLETKLDEIEQIGSDAAPELAEDVRAALEEDVAPNTSEKFLDLKPQIEPIEDVRFGSGDETDDPTRGGLVRDWVWVSSSDDAPIAKDLEQEKDSSVVRTFALNLKDHALAVADYAVGVAEDLADWAASKRS